MSAPIKAMSVIKQILRLSLQGNSIKSIARNAGVSKNTVKKYLQLSGSLGIGIEKLFEMEDPVLEKLFMGKSSEEDHPSEELKEIMPKLVEELNKVGVTRWTIWGKYRALHPNGYSYSRFCYHLQQHMEYQKATMHIDHSPGECVYVDFAGKKLPITDHQTGEIRQVEVLVAMLGFSQLTYVEALESQRLGDFIRAMENALYYFGGTPKVVVSDNLKSAIKTASRYEPDVNETFLDFANHYNMGVAPTRPYKPKDKALVEGGVKIIYSRVYAILRNRVFTQLGELNTAIGQCVDNHNRMLFQGLNESRWDRFINQEKQVLQKLPVNRFEIKTIVELTVQTNCHVRITENKNYYSAPHRYIGKKVRVIYTHQNVSIYYKGTRIAYHRRSFKPGFYTTVKDHLSSTHQFYLDWSPQKFISWGKGIDLVVADYIEKVLASRPYPEQGYKSCLGILSLAKKEGKENLIAACKRASSLGVHNYCFIKNQLQNKTFLDIETNSQYRLPLHENIRGANNYQ